LVTVELSYGRAFDLTEGDAEVLIQLRDGAILWQKERLLNLALSALPPHCDAVAWVDCDVVFARRDWQDAVIERLQDAAMVQPFRHLYYLDEGKGPADDDSGRADGFESAASRKVNGSLPAECFRVAGASRKFKYVPGGVWVARRDLLVECGGFYDAAILGSGDKLMFAAGCGRHADAARGIHMNAPQWQHYQSWAEKFHELVSGRISFVSGDLFHLWHGDLGHRGYAQRYEGFSQFDFDPRADIVLGHNGVWHWNTHKPDLHAHTQRLFASLAEGISMIA
jgi:hypothetical protein